MTGADLHELIEKLKKENVRLVFKPLKITYCKANIFNGLNYFRLKSLLLKKKRNQRSLA
jgi:hypothetical protein